MNTQESFLFVIKIPLLTWNPITNVPGFWSFYISTSVDKVRETTCYITLWLSELPFRLPTRALLLDFFFCITLKAVNKATGISISNYSLKVQVGLRFVKSTSLLLKGWTGGENFTEKLKNDCFSNKKAQVWNEGTSW